ARMATTHAQIVNPSSFFIIRKPRLRKTPFRANHPRRQTLPTSRPEFMKLGCTNTQNIPKFHAFKRQIFKFVIFSRCPSPPKCSGVARPVAYNGAAGQEYPSPQAGGLRLRAAWRKSGFCATRHGAGE